MDFLSVCDVFSWYMHFIYCSKGVRSQEKDKTWRPSDNTLLVLARRVAGSNPYRRIIFHLKSYTYDALTFTAWSRVELLINRIEPPRAGTYSYMLPPM